MTEPTPPITPSTKSERSGPSLMFLPMASPNHATPSSIQSMGYCPSVKVVWNITNKIRKNNGKPNYLFDSRLSKRCVS